RGSAARRAQTGSHHQAGRHCSRRRAERAGAAKPLLSSLQWHTCRVRFAGILGEDAPDPRLEWIEQARQMPVPIIGLVPQRHREDWGAIGVGTGTRNGVLDMCEVSVGYTLWRNPDDHDDPVNLASLDFPDESEPPWPRPQWLIEQVRRMRYPMLWECVRTR